MRSEEVTSGACPYMFNEETRGFWVKPGALDFESARQEEFRREESQDKEFRGEESVASSGANGWQWHMTSATEAVLKNAHTFAKLLRHPEATSEHLLAMLALDEAGEGEIHRRGYVAKGA